MRKVRVCVLSPMAQYGKFFLSKYDVKSGSFNDQYSCNERDYSLIDQHHTDAHRCILYHQPSRSIPGIFLPDTLCTHWTFDVSAERWPRWYVGA